LVFIGFVIACCAAIAGGSAGAADRAVRPAAVHAAHGQADAQLARGAAQAGGPAGFGGLRGAGTTSAGGAANVPFADSAPLSGLAASGIPSTALQAYQQAAAREAVRMPGCGLTWPLLAGIGRVESDHGRFAGAVLHSDGVSTPRIIGIPLNGSGTALIRDTDGGRLDGDTVYDRAVGPMQFIPSTWANWGVDANHDGVVDPFNIFDAAAAAADYLCAAGHDLTTTHGQVQAILSYNYSYDYVSMVMGLERIYGRQVGITVPVLPTTPEPLHGRPARHPSLPPVDPGKPRGVLDTGNRPPPSAPSQPGRPAGAGGSSSAANTGGGGSSGGGSGSSTPPAGGSSSDTPPPSTPPATSPPSSGSSSPACPTPSQTPPPSSASPSSPDPTPTCPSPSPSGSSSSGSQAGSGPAQSSP
jgi:membrane-bound lytic murein transglycosylase B